MTRAWTMPAFWIALLCALAAQAQQPANLLQDASFEEALYDPFSTNWCTFGGTSCEALTPRSRTFVAKLFGLSPGAQNYSGIYQDVPASAGKRYIASGWFRHNSGDTLQGRNEAWVKLEFWSDQGILAAQESPTRLRAKGPANKYLFLSTGPSQAPRGTAKARFVAIFGQDADNSRGAVVVDDVELKEIP